MSQPTDCNKILQQPLHQLDEFSISDEPYNETESQAIIQLNQEPNLQQLSPTHQSSLRSSSRDNNVGYSLPNRGIAPGNPALEAQLQGKIDYTHPQSSIRPHLIQGGLPAHPNRTRRRNEGLSNEEMRMLRKDLNQGIINKKGLMKKYSVSESTLNRYIRKFKEFQTTSQNIGEASQTMIHNQAMNLPLGNIELPNQTHQRSECNQQMAPDALYPEGYYPFVSRKKNSKVRMIQAKLIQIYKQYPQIYQSEVASMLSEHFKQQITVHVVSRCLRNISNRQRELSLGRKPEMNAEGGHELNPFELTVQNRYAFARQFLQRNPKFIVYIDQVLFHGVIDKKEQAVHFVLGVSGEGSILHWKLKNHIFLSNEIAKFIDQIYLKHQGCTILLDNVNMHREQPIRQLFKSKAVSHLYLPPCSPQLNPIEPIFSYIAAQLTNRLKDSFTLHYLSNSKAKQSGKVKIAVGEEPRGEKSPAVNQKANSSCKYLTDLCIYCELEFTLEDVSAAPVREDHTDVQAHGHHHEMPSYPHLLLLCQRIFLLWLQLLVHIHCILEFDKLFLLLIIRRPVYRSKARDQDEKA